MPIRREHTDHGQTRELWIKAITERNRNKTDGRSGPILFVLLDSSRLEQQNSKFVQEKVDKISRFVCHKTEKIESR